MNILHKAKCIINNKPLPKYLRRHVVDEIPLDGEAEKKTTKKSIRFRKGNLSKSS